MQGGHVVGELISGKELVEYAGRNAFRHHLWMWKCARCEETRGPSTLSHLRRSAGCAACAVLRENNGRWLGYREISGSFMYQYRSDAAKRGREWAVTGEYLWEVWEQQRGRCRYTGWQLEHGATASLDRIDSAGGYVEGNVQWVHREINQMKSDRTEARFLTLCQAVAGFDASVPSLISGFARGF